MMSHECTHIDSNVRVERKISSARISARSLEEQNSYNPVPQAAPGASAAVGHTIANSIPLSIFPIATDKFCICFCGLPGRGKTHISRRLARYLSFFHAVPVELFNVREYRRKTCSSFRAADWFHPDNLESKELREKYNTMAITDMVIFLNLNSNGVGIFDATNATHEQRARLVATIRPTGAKMLFIEVSNNDETLLTESYRTAAATSPEYEGMDDKEAELDYRGRVNNYAAFFETLDAATCHPVEGGWSYFKCDHSKHHFMVHRIRGYLPLKVVHFIMNLRTSSHAFYLTRHGQSEYNAIGRIGGDSGLSFHGLNYAKKLAEFVAENITSNKMINEEKRKGDEGENNTYDLENVLDNRITEAVPARLWTSTMRRTRETCQFIAQSKLLMKYVFILSSVRSSLQYLTFLFISTVCQSLIFNSFYHDVATLL